MHSNLIFFILCTYCALRNLSLPIPKIFSSKNQILWFIFRSLIHLELSLEYGVKWRLNFISHTIFVERSNFLHLYHISSLHTYLGVYSWLYSVLLVHFSVYDETCVLITMILYYVLIWDITRTPNLFFFLFNPGSLVIWGPLFFHVNIKILPNSKKIHVEINNGLHLKNCTFVMLNFPLAKYTI